MSSMRADATAMTEYEARQVAAANTSDRTPVVFIHGLWVLPRCWERWVAACEEAGYVALTPGWPGDPGTVAEAREHPEVFARRSVAQMVAHLEDVVSRLKTKPALVGHSFGGLLTQIIAGHGKAAVSVAISPAPFRGVLPMPISLVRSVLPVLVNPANRHRAVSLSYKQYRYAVTNATNDEEAAVLYETYGVPAGGKALFQAALANVNPWTQVKVDTRNPERGPLMIISGERDRFIPWSIAQASCRRQQRNGGVTEIVEIAGRGHSLPFDDGWREVADVAFGFIRRFD
jgi:pimeloyl-ACP methyl ester carboxylesterase